MTAHAFFSASGASRWLKCGASAVIDTRHLPEEYKPAADRGTRLHAISEAWLRDDVEPPAGLDPPDREAVEAYVDFVRARSGRKFYELTTQFVGDVWGGDFILCGGTADTVLIYNQEKLLEIIDAKFGSWYVDPTDNDQLTIYALGVLRRFAAVFDFEDVDLTIAQPACDNFRTCRVGVDALESRGREIRARVEAIMAGDAEFNPGEETCKWCPGRTICPAFAEYGKAAARAEFDDDVVRGGLLHDSSKAHEKASVLHIDPLDWTWGQKMRVAELAGSWAKMVKDTVKRMVLDDPEAVPGFKSVEGRRSKSWDGDEGKKAAKNYLEAEGFGETDIFTEPVFVSPAAAEKLFRGKGSGTKKKELSEFVKVSAGAPTVVSESDSRPAIKKGDTAREEFSDK